MPNANEKQVGGEHYRNGFQHWDFVIEYGNRYLEGQISRYLTRWRKKDGFKDLQKAVHYFDKLIEAVDNAYVSAPVLDVTLRNISSVADYARLNDIDSELVIVIYTIHTWTSRNELLNARMRLNEYVKLHVVETTTIGDATPRYVAQ